MPNNEVYLDTATLKIFGYPPTENDGPWLDELSEDLQLSLEAIQHRLSVKYAVRVEIAH